MPAKKDLREEILKEAQELRTQSKRQLPIGVCVVLAAGRSYDKIKCLGEDPGFFSLPTGSLIGGVYNDGTYVLHLKCPGNYGSNEVSGDAKDAIIGPTTIKQKEEAKVIWNHGPSTEQNPKGLYVSLGGNFGSVYVKIATIFHTSDTEYAVQASDIASYPALGWKIKQGEKIALKNKILLFNRVDTSKEDGSECKNSIRCLIPSEHNNLKQTNKNK